ncbi:MAG: sialate O-acetylesterase [Alphaproteobacteria bacterium]|nr:sialate O-acetylesterase [Alphaproteobacteria bacterium]
MPPEKTAKYLVVFAGQSNMLGHRLATGGDKVVNPDVSAWAPDRGWQVARHGTAPFNTRGDSPNNAALQFADTLQRAKGGRVYLVGNPVNGSSIVSWRNARAENLAELLHRVAAALASPELAGPGERYVDSLLWCQGESDDPSATMVEAPRLMERDAYVEAFAELAEVLMAQRWWDVRSSRFLASEMVEDGWLSARNDFYRMPALWPEGLRMAVSPSAGMGHVGDRAHFDGPALVEMGHRLFALREQMPD